MKKLSLLLAICLTSVFGCCKKEDKTSGTDKACGDHEGHQLYKDSSGDCYYMDNGNRVAVEAHECNC